MTETQLYLYKLPEDIQKKFIPIFGDTATFYEVMYLVVRNRHYLELHPDIHSEKNVDIMRMILFKVRRMIKRYGVDGKKVLADIQKEYMDDFNKNRVQEQRLDDSRFLEIVQYISTL